MPGPCGRRMAGKQVEKGALDFLRAEAVRSPRLPLRPADGSLAEAKRPSRVPWAQLLERPFGEDVFTCEA